MRFGLIALAAVGMLGIGVATADANDGCGYDRSGRFDCKPGARPGVPYYGNRGYAAPYQGRYQGGYRGGYQGGPYYQRREKRNPCPPYWTVQSGVCKPYRGY